MEGGDAIGEAVTGGLVARAVEPHAGEDASGVQEGHCLNCGTELVGDFCHCCGQAGHVHRTVSSWWHDVAHGVLHFEGKIWRTLPLLAWHPGEITRRFIAGERARFVSPLALFLFTVFLMFALLSALGGTSFNLSDADLSTTTEEIRRADAEIARIEARIRHAEAAGRPAPDLEQALRAAQIERRAAAAATGQERLFKGEPKTGWARLDAGLKKANENPQLLAYKLQTGAYKYSWALIPISLPFLWMLFLHRRRYRERYKAYDHLVFITYSISFMSMLLVVYVLIRTIGINIGLLNLAFLLFPAVHIYRQLRGAYGLSWGSALWRTGALIAMAVVAILLFVALLVALGLFV
jgi:hypothetical protein